MNRNHVPETPETAFSAGRMAMPMCPLVKMCTGMRKRPSGVSLVLAGSLLILFGALIAVQPRLLVWSIAVASVLLGIMLLGLAGFIRKMSAHG